MIKQRWGRGFLYNKRSLQKTLPLLKRAMGLDDWNIHLCFRKKNESVATCSRHVDYQIKEAWITFEFYAVEIFPKRGLEDSLLHEMCHILHSPTDAIFNMSQIFEDKREYVHEGIVGNLERMFESCGLTAEHLIRLHNKNLKRIANRKRG